MALVKSGSMRLRGGAMVLAVVLAALGALVAPAAAVAAPSCTSPSHNVNGEGSGIMNGTYNLKVAPYADCGTIRSVPKGAEIFYHCLYVNDYGNLWVYGRVAGTSTSGWMSINNMTDTWLDDDGDGSYEEAFC